MPTVPVRASCVPLAGHAACIAALGSAVLACGGSACGGLGCGALACAVCTVDVAGGLRRGGSTVTCGNGSAFGRCCAGVAGDGDASGCVASCAAGGDAWARTSLAPAAASAR